MQCSYQEMSQLCRGLALLLHAGIGLSEGLYLLAEDETAPMDEILRQLGRSLGAGSALSAAMDETQAFPSHAISMIRIGEYTGQLEETLEALAGYYDTQLQNQRQIRQAAAYPSFIFLLMLAVIGVLLIHVLPVFDSVYASLGSRLTGIAAGLLYLGQGLKQALPLLFLLLVLAVSVFLLFYLSASLRSRFSLWFRQRWRDRGICRLFNNARFARALSMGLCSGLPLEQAMELAVQLLSDLPGAAARCEQCRLAMERGSDLASAMGQAGLLTAAQSRMLALGLRSGKADQVMRELAEQVSADADEALARRIAKIEPTMVLAASLLVGAILLSVMLPLMHILSTLG